VIIKKKKGWRKEPKQQIKELLYLVHNNYDFNPREKKKKKKVPMYI
jgi:hypothetical protein